ncbi:GNAT family N-acetyltransferase [Nocardioides alcanivorans]|uniref:GNAT family N-acetyltransferase n=1 Tax=Nocardioides alcanivorans TaxID=2897352 RepID=UPI001F191526|nr:GNAT family N-acetyltransferase [Nocardioides alcanivorans]
MAPLTAPIRTERLLLRTFRPDDIDALLDYQRIPEVARYLLVEPWTREYAEQQVVKRLRSTGLGGPDDVLALAVELDGRVIGDIAVWPTDAEARQGELGWVFHPEVGGRGYATEAVAAAMEHAFDAGWHRAVAQMDPRNTASAKLARRLGMTLEGAHRSSWWSKGEWTDNWVFALLADDWRARRTDPTRAPQPEGRRASPGALAPDREALEGWLELYRQTLPRKIAGLAADQLCRAAVEPSNLSLAVLVRHLTTVEQAWFANTVAGLAEPLHHRETGPSGDFDPVDPGTVWDDLARYQRELVRSREFAAAVTDLDAPLPGVRHGRQVNLRWVYLHMIEEYARHLGHADLLRERVDGVTGY